MFRTFVIFASYRRRSINASVRYERMKDEFIFGFLAVDLDLPICYSILVIRVIRYLCRCVRLALS